MGDAQIEYQIPNLVMIFGMTREDINDFRIFFDN